jgi:signal transduction histidine kinase
LKGLEFKLAALVLETRADPKTNEKLRNVYDATRDILRRAQNLSAAMLPDGLAKEDLMRRIQCDMENIAHERGAKLLLLADFDYEAPSDDDAAQIFRIVQESVLNAAIHGKAAKIVVEFMKRKGRPSLRIRDDGSGFDARPASARTSLGLGIMRARAKTIGARIQIVSAKGEGTTVVCSPLPEKRNPRKD